MATRQEILQDMARRGLLPGGGAPSPAAAPPTPPPPGAPAPESEGAWYDPFAPGGMATKEGWELPSQAAAGFRGSTIGRLAGMDQSTAGPPSSLPEKVASGIGGMAGSPFALVGSLGGPAGMAAGFGTEDFVRAKLEGKPWGEAAKEGVVGAAGGLAFGYGGKIIPALLPEARMVGDVLTPIQRSLGKRIGREAAHIGAEAAGGAIGHSVAEEVKDQGPDAMIQHPGETLARIGGRAGEEFQSNVGMAGTIHLGRHLASVTRLRQRLTRAGKTDVTQADADAAEAAGTTGQPQTPGSGGGAAAATPTAGQAATPGQPPTPGQPAAPAAAAAGLPTGDPNEMVRIRFMGKPSVLKRSEAEALKAARPNDVEIIEKKGRRGQPPAPPPTPPAGAAPVAPTAPPAAPAAAAATPGFDQVVTKAGELLNLPQGTADIFVQANPGARKVTNAQPTPTPAAVVTPAETVPAGTPGSPIGGEIGAGVGPEPAAAPAAPVAPSLLDQAREVMAAPENSGLSPEQLKMLVQRNLTIAYQNASRLVDQVIAEQQGAAPAAAATPAATPAAEPTVAAPTAQPGPLDLTTGEALSPDELAAMAALAPAEPAAAEPTPPPAATPAPAAVPPVLPPGITPEMGAKLQHYGMTPEDIRQMSPEEAVNLIRLEEEADARDQAEMGDLGDEEFDDGGDDGSGEGGGEGGGGGVVLGANLGNMGPILRGIYEKYKARQQARAEARAATTESEPLRPIQPPTPTPESTPEPTPAPVPEPVPETAPSVPTPEPTPTPLTPEEQATAQPLTMAPQTGGGYMALAHRTIQAKEEADRLRAKGGLPETVQQFIDESVQDAVGGLREMDEYGRDINEEQRARRMQLIKEEVNLVHDLPLVDADMQSLLMGDTMGVFFPHEEGGGAGVRQMAERYPSRLAVFTGESGNVLYRPGGFEDATAQLKAMDEAGELPAVAENTRVPPGEAPEQQRGTRQPPMSSEWSFDTTHDQPVAKRERIFKGRKAHEVVRSIAGQTIDFVNKHGMIQHGRVLRDLSDDQKIVVFEGFRAGASGEEEKIYTRIEPGQILGVSQYEESGPVKSVGAQGVKGYDRRLHEEELPGPKPEPASAAGEHVTMPNVGGMDQPVGKGSVRAFLRGHRALRRTMEGRLAKTGEPGPVKSLEEPGPGPMREGGLPTALHEVPETPQERVKFHVGDTVQIAGQPDKDWTVAGVGAQARSGGYRKAPAGEPTGRRSLLIFDPEQRENQRVVEVGKIERLRLWEGGGLHDIAEGTEGLPEGRIAKLARRERTPVVQGESAITAPGRPAETGALETGGSQPGGPLPAKAKKPRAPRKGSKAAKAIEAKRAADEAAAAAEVKAKADAAAKHNAENAARKAAALRQLHPVAEGIEPEALKGLQSKFPLGSRIKWGKLGGWKLTEAGKRNRDTTLTFPERVKMGLVEQLPGAENYGTVIGYRMDKEGHPAPVVTTDAGERQGVAISKDPRRMGTEIPEQKIAGLGGKSTVKAQQGRLTAEELAEKKRQQARDTPPDAKSQQKPHAKVPGPEAQPVRMTDAAKAAVALKGWWVQARLKSGQLFHGYVSGKATKNFVQLWDSKTVDGKAGPKWIAAKDIDYRLPRGRRPEPEPEAGEPGSEQPTPGVRSGTRERGKVGELILPEHMQETSWEPGLEPKKGEAPAKPAAPPTAAAKPTAGPSLEGDGVYQLKQGQLSAGITVADGKVTSTGPAFRWMVGKDWAEVRKMLPQASVEKQGGKPRPPKG